MFLKKALWKRDLESQSGVMLHSIYTVKMQIFSVFAMELQIIVLAKKCEICIVKYFYRIEYVKQKKEKTGERKRPRNL